MAAFLKCTLNEQRIIAATAADGSAGASSAQELAKASRKRPLTDAEGSDTEDAAVADPAASGSVGTSRRLHVPSRPSGAGTSVRPHGKAVPPEVRCRSAHIVVAQKSPTHEAEHMLQGMCVQTGITQYASPSVDL